MTRYAKPERLPPVVVRLAFKRKLVGMSRRELSRKLGYCDQTISHWERGTARPSMKALVDWCDSLGMELDAREAVR